MRIVQDDLWLCVDCLFVSVVGNYEHIDYHYGRGESPGRGELRDGARERAAEVDAGLARLGPNLVTDHDSETGLGIEEFSISRCDCCGSKLYGARYRFAVLGSDARDLNDPQD